MKTINMEELTAKVAEIIQRVVEDQKGYLVIEDGQPVAVITPFVYGQSDQAECGNSEDSSAWDDLFQLGQRISENWSSDQLPGEALSNMRR